MLARTPRRSLLAVATALVLALASAALVPISASAATPGSIGGVVSLASGKAAAGVKVQAVELGFDLLPKRRSATVTSSATGAFTVSNLSEGTYALWFSGTSGHFAQYLGGSTTIAGSDTVRVSAGVASYVRAGLAASGTATVTVKSTTGKAVKGVVVSAFSQNDVGEWIKRGSASTSTAGLAIIPGLNPGVHRLGVVSSTGAVPTLFSGNAQTVESAADIRITAGRTTAYTFSAPTTGTVTGILRDSGSTAVVGATITAYRFAGPAGAFWAATRTPVSAVSKIDGSFSLSGLLPGNYTLRFDPRAASGLGESYYGGDMNALDAQYFEITAGGTVSLVDAVVASEGSVSGTVVYFPGFAPQANVPIFAWPVYELGSYNQTTSDIVAVTAADGTFSASGLAPGSWRIMAGTLNPELQSNPAYNAFFSPDTRSVTVVAGNTTSLPVFYVGELSETTNPTELTPIVVSGVAAVGNELTVTPAAYDNPADATPAHWLRDGKAIPGAVGSTYTLVGADGGHEISVRQTSRFSRHIQRTAQSSPLTIALGDAPLRDGAVAFAGNLTVGSTLTGLPGQWDLDGVKVSYNWCFDDDGNTLCDGARVPGNTYTIVAADQGRDMLVEVVADRLGYEQGSARFFMGTVGEGALLATATPTVTKVGSTLTVSTGSWSAAPTSYAYLWEYRDAPSETWVAVGTNSKTFNVSGFSGRQLWVTVTAGRAGFANGTKTVRAQTGTAASAAGSISLNSSYAPPSVISAPAATWPSDIDGDETTLTYVWQYRSGTIWKNLSGATSPTLALGASHVGKSIRVVMTARTAGYTTKALTTNATSITPIAAPSMPGGLTVNGGAPVSGATLTMDATAWDLPSVTSTYYWKYSADGVTWTIIPGATKASYTVSDIYFGSQLLAGIRGSKSGHTTGVEETVLGTIAAGTLTLKSPGSLTLSQGVWRVTPPTAQQGQTVNTYQWYRVAPGTEVATDLGIATSVTAAQASGEYLRVHAVMSRTGYGNLTTQVYGAAQSGLGVSSFGVLEYELGVPRVGQTITVTDGTWNTPTPTTISYQWYYSSAGVYKKIAGATGSTFVPTPAQLGSTIVAYVTGSRGGYTSTTLITSDSPTVSLGFSATPSTLPSIASSPVVGTPVSGTTGAGWSQPGMTFTYEWRRGASPTVIATTRTYTPVAADVGFALKYKITASTPGYSGSFYEMDSDAVVPGTLTLVKSPTVTKSGTTLSATTGTWNVTPTTALTTVGWNVYDRATGVATYTAGAKLNVASLSGKYITAVVNANRAGYTTGTGEKLAQAGRAAAYTGSDTIVIVGNTVSAFSVGQASSWDLQATTSYTWKRNGVAITGAGNGHIYVRQVADTGKTISATVTKSKPGYSTGSKTFTLSAPMDAINSIASTAAPVASGTARVGGSILGTPGLWSVSSLGYAYQWFVVEPALTAIPNATSSSWTPTAEYAGRTVHLRVTASKAYYSSVAAVSNAIAIDYGGAATVSRAPAVSKNSSTLTATVGTVTPGFTVAVQWFTVAGGMPTAIVGATGITTPAQAGVTYRAVFTATRPGHLTTAFSTADFVVQP